MISYLKREGEKEKTKETEQQNPGTLGPEKHFLRSFKIGQCPMKALSKRHLFSNNHRRFHSLLQSMMLRFQEMSKEP